MTTDDQADPLERHERRSLRVWGHNFSASARTTIDGRYELAFLIRRDAPRDAEGVAVLTVGDVAKLRALLDEMELRGDAVLRPRVADEEWEPARSVPGYPGIDTQDGLIVCALHGLEGCRQPPCVDLTWPPGVTGG